VTERIDPDRHLSIFEPNRWGQRRIDILGLGATGSMTAQLISRLGIENLHLHDFDEIKATNIANQLYPLEAIGRPKAETCRDLIRAATGIEPTIHGKCEGPAETPEDELGDVVFLCMDSMSARANVVNERLAMNAGTQLVIDTRMGVDELRLYSFCPYRLKELRRYRSTITPDEDTLENACEIKTTLAGTAAMVAGLSKTWFLHWYRREIVGDREYQPLPFEIIMTMRPLMIHVNS
jgi:hypothetical protein